MSFLSKISQFNPIFKLVSCIVFVCTTTMTQAANVHFAIENDFWARTDRYYTNGIHLRAELGQYVVGASQLIFTPRNADEAGVNTSDRPWGGLIYFNVGAHTEENRTWRWYLGFTGHKTYADRLQENWHDYIGIYHPAGWRHQLPSELVLNLQYEQTWSHSWGQSFIGYELGTISTKIYVGLEGFKNSKRQLIDISLQRNSWVEPISEGWYFAGGIKAYLVFWDLSLDGTAFRSSYSVEKLPVVADIYGLMGYSFEGWAVAFNYNLRTKEFINQHDVHLVGGLQLSYYY